jgi:hypothetical protein
MKVGDKVKIDSGGMLGAILSEGTVVSLMDENNARIRVGKDEHASIIIVVPTKDLSVISEIGE